MLHTFTSFQQTDKPLAAEQLELGVNLTPNYFASRAGNLCNYLYAEG